MSSTNNITTDSPVKQFNATVYDFVNDLKTIFGEQDKDIQTIEMACDMTKINVRLVLTPFQQYISGNPVFVKNIMDMNVDYFLTYNYDHMVKQASQLSDDYNNKLILKFSEATKLHRRNPQTVKSIFNWFKVMMYHAYHDEGKHPQTEMQMCQQMTFGNEANEAPAAGVGDGRATGDGGTTPSHATIA